MFTSCEGCGRSHEWVLMREGHFKQFCSDACKQRAYRERRRQEAEQRVWEEQARRRRQEQSYQDQWQEQQRAGRGRHGRTAWTSAAEARELVFRLAELRDDGIVTLKRAYRVAARLWHPDVSTRPDAAATFKLLGEAYAAYESLLRHGQH